MLLQNHFSAVKQGLELIVHKKIVHKIVEKYCNSNFQKLIQIEENIGTTMDFNKLQPHIFLQVDENLWNQIKINGNPNTIKSITLESIEQTNLQFPSEQFVSFCKILRKFQNLVQLTINITNSITNEQMSLLNEELKNLTNMQKIKINIHLQEQKELLQLGEILRLQKSLRSLHLEIDISQTENNEELEAFLDNITYLSSLQELKLQINPQQNMVNQNQNQGKLCRNFLKNLDKLKLLKVLILKFKETCPLDPQNALYFSKSLQNLGNMKEFHLLIDNQEHLQIEGINHLATGIKSLQKLEILTLNIEDFTIIEGSGIQKIYEVLQYLSNLTQFTTQLDEGVGGDQGVQILSTSLIKLTKLEQLHLYFNYNSQIEEQGFLYLGVALSKLERLKNLTISVFQLSNDQNKNMGEQSAKYLGNSLKQLRSLEHLNLVISNQNCITREGALAIAEGLHSLQNLRFISLYIGNDNNIGIEGSEAIGKALKELPNLKKVHLQIEKKQFAYKYLPDEIIMTKNN